MPNNGSDSDLQATKTGQLIKKIFKELISVIINNEDR